MDLASVFPTQSLLNMTLLLQKRQVALGFNILPSETKPIFTTLVWHNNDFGEETISGKGTTHNTNGIIIQWPSIPSSDKTQSAQSIYL